MIRGYKSSTSVYKFKKLGIIVLFDPFERSVRTNSAMTKELVKAELEVKKLFESHD